MATPPPGPREPAESLTGSPAPRRKSRARRERAGRRMRIPVRMPGFPSRANVGRANEFAATTTRSPPARTGPSRAGCHAGTEPGRDKHLPQDWGRSRGIERVGARGGCRPSCTNAVIPLIPSQSEFAATTPRSPPARTGRHGRAVTGGCHAGAEPGRDRHLPQYWGRWRGIERVGARGGCRPSCTNAVLPLIPSQSEFAATTPRSPPARTIRHGRVPRRRGARPRRAPPP